MKKVFNTVISAMLILSGLILTGSLSSCKQEHINYSTTSVENIYSYLNSNEDDFSMFKQIVDRAGYGSFLNTYGIYTLFATNNAGVTAYLKKTGKTGVENIDVATCKNIVAISLIANDTIPSTLFSDGRMRTPTTSNQYLITSVTNSAGVSTIVINKQAKLVSGNIRLGNGIVHVVDNILLPATLTVAQTIEQNPRYSIFTAALKATGFYDSLNVDPVSNPQNSRKFLTLIAQTDSVFKVAGLNDFAAVRAKYSTKNDPKNHQDSLWLFVAYRVWPELSYLSDIASSTIHSTLAPNEQSSSKLLGEKVLVNYDLVSGVQEPGQELYRPNSDISATNGVIHSANTNYRIVVRAPAPVYFDLVDQPEINKIKSPTLFSRTVVFQPGSLSKVTMFGSGNYYVEYHNDAMVPANYFFNNDWMQHGVRFRTGSNGQNAVQYVTPVIIKGRYKVWVDFKNGQGAQTVNVLLDGEPLPNIFNPGDALSTTETPAQAEVRGYKSYSESPNANGNGHVGRLLGVVNITKTGTHTIRFVATAGSGDARQLWLDVVEFRPVDMNQLRPLLGRNGNLIP